MSRGVGRSRCLSVARGGLPIGVLFLFLAVSCGQEPRLTLPPSPDVKDSGVMGRVTVAGKGVGVQIRAERLSDYQHSLSVTVYSDSVGYFFVPLEPGRYQLAASGDSLARTSYWSPSGPTYEFRNSDTLVVVEGEKIRANFDHGRLVATISGVPSQFDGRSAGLNGYTWSSAGQGSYHWQSRSATIRSGQVKLDSRGIPPGLYGLALGLSGVSPLIWLPGSLTASEADSVRVFVSHVATLSRELNIKAARIRGTLHGSWELLGSNDELVLRVVTEDSVSVCTTGVHDDGTFEVDVPVVSRVRLCTTIYGADRWIGGESFAEATTFSLVSGGVTEVPPYRDSGLLIRVVPLDPWSVFRAALRVVVPSGRSFRAVVPMFSGDLLLLPNLGPGSYRVCLQPTQLGSAPWMPQWYGGGDAYSTAVPIEIPPEGQVARVTMQLARGGEIGGIVVDPGAPTTDGLDLALTPADSPVAWAFRYTINGAFRFLGVPDGSWKVAYYRVHPFDPANATWYGGASWDSAAVITVRDHAVVDGIEIRLP